MCQKFSCLGINQTGETDTYAADPIRGNHGGLECSLHQAGCGLQYFAIFLIYGIINTGKDDCPTVVTNADTSGDLRDLYTDKIPGIRNDIHRQCRTPGRHDYIVPIFK